MILYVHMYLCLFTELNIHIRMVHISSFVLQQVKWLVNLVYQSVYKFNVKFTDYKSSYFVELQTNSGTWHVKLFDCWLLERISFQLVTGER